MPWAPFSHIRLVKVSVCGSKLRVFGSGRIINNRSAPKTSSSGGHSTSQRLPQSQRSKKSRGRTTLDLGTVQPHSGSIMSALEQFGQSTIQRPQLTRGVRRPVSPQGAILCTSAAVTGHLLGLAVSHHRELMNVHAFVEAVSGDIAVELEH